jgi:hypothetical protein
VAAARAVVAAPADVAVVAVADAVGLVPVADAALPVEAARVVVHAGKAEDAAVRVADDVKAKAAIAMADAEMAEASSSRT